MKTIKAKVHMLPTEDISQVHYNKVRYPNEIKYELSFHKEPSKCKNDGLCSGNQHLYITNDETPNFKHPRYKVNGNRLEVWDADDMECLDLVSIEIIATTDPKLTTKEVIKVGDRVHSNKQDFNDQIVATESSAKLYNKSDHYFKSLVRIPQSFIEEYCKAGGIDEVDVEYNDKGVVLRGRGGERTITIHPIKDSWSREEVEELCRDAFSLGQQWVHEITFTDKDPMTVNKWIEENL